MDEQPNVTRGFLFADLRGYTAFVEARGDAAGAALLHAYRGLVREVIARYSGAEIRTEGDSFYVTFPSASGAVGAAVAITAAAIEASKRDPSLPIAVGVGVHAGETQSTDEGPVGSAVNIAARLAALAAPGEVLVTETVRGLTRTSGNVYYLSRGNRRLKGIADPVTVFAAASAAAAPVTVSRRLLGPGRSAPVAALAGFAVIGVLVLSTIYLAGGGAAHPSASATSTAPGLAELSASPSATIQSASPSESASESPSAAATQLVKVLTIMDTGTENGTRRRVLAPGTYTIQDLQPAYAFTVESGWVWNAIGYDPGDIRLELTDRPTSFLNIIRLDVLTTDACGFQSPALFSQIGSFNGWLRAQPGLVVGPDVARIFGPITAIQNDVTVAAKGTCSYTSPPSVMIRPDNGGSLISFQLSLGQVASVYTYDLAGATFAAWAVAPTQAESRVLIPKVDALLETLAPYSP